MAGEAVADVQATASGRWLKAIAADFVRLIHSPSTGRYFHFASFRYPMKTFIFAAAFGLAAPSLLRADIEPIPIEPAEDLVWSVEDYEAETGAQWLTLRFPTVPGMLYSLQSSSDLSSWDDDAVFYGLGHELHLALFEKVPPPPPPPGEDPPAPLPPATMVTLRAEPSTSSGTVLMWRSLADPDLQIVHAVTGEMVEAWDRQPFYWHQQGDVQLFIMSARYPFDPPPLPMALEPEDQAVADAFSAALPELNQQVTENVEQAELAPPPPPPSPGARRFYRLARVVTDTDGDGLPDWYEFGVSGTEAFLADTDGDGADDHLEHLAFSDVRSASSGGSVLVDPDSQRRFENTRYALVRLDPDNVVSTYPRFKGMSASGQVVWKDGNDASWLWNRGERTVLGAAARRLTWSGYLLSDGSSPGGNSTVRRLDPETGGWLGSATELSPFPESEVEVMLRGALGEDEELISWSVADTVSRGYGITEGGIVYGESWTTVDAHTRLTPLDDDPVDIHGQRTLGGHLVVWASPTAAPEITTAQGLIDAEGEAQGGGNLVDYEPHAVNDPLGAVLAIAEPFSMAGYRASGAGGAGPWYPAVPSGVVLPEYCPFAATGVGHSSSPSAEGSRPQVFRVGPQGGRHERIPLDEGEGWAATISRHGVVFGEFRDEAASPPVGGARLWRRLPGDGSTLEWAACDLEEAVGGLEEGEDLEPARFVSGEEEDEGAPERLLAHLTIATGVEPVMLVKAELVPDWNRDGKIDAGDSGKATIGKPWRFWINDDRDETGTSVSGNDVPNMGAGDNINLTIDGLRDLVDFFPIHLRIGGLLVTHPPDRFRYHLESPGGDWQFAFFETDLSSGDVGDYLTGGLGDVLARDNPNGIAVQGSVAGVKLTYQASLGAYLGNLDTERLNRIITDPSRGVVLVEGTEATQAGLDLVVRDEEAAEQARVHLPVSTSGVEAMFRHRNLRTPLVSSDPAEQQKETENPPAPGRGGEPSNLPDSYCNEDWLVFLHGYNVNGKGARGWHSEAFKRYFWAGSRAKFHALSWYGDETQNLTVGVTPKYYENVENALNTSEPLAEFINGLEGGRKFAASHSLGGLVVADSIASHGADLEKAFLYDPAFATESLLPGEFVSNDVMMEPSTWRPYMEDIKASEWYQLFAATDARGSLSWRGVLHTAAPDLEIYYSSGEEVLAALPADLPADPGWAGQKPVGTYAFALQAMLKGMLGQEPDEPQSEWLGRLTSLLTHVFESFSPASDHGGWRVVRGNEAPHWLSSVLNPVDQQYTYYNRSPQWFIDQKAADPAAFIARLARDPVFGTTLPPGCEGLFDPGTGHAVAANAPKRRRILAQMIPERTLPAGGAGGSGVGTEVPSLKQKFALSNAGTITTHEMQSEEMMPNGWPGERPAPVVGNGWRHGDIKDVAYLYVWKAWKQPVEDHGLDQEPEGGE